MQFHLSRITYTIKINYCNWIGTSTMEEEFQRTSAFPERKEEFNLIILKVCSNRYIADLL